MGVGYQLYIPPARMPSEVRPCLLLVTPFWDSVGTLVAQLGGKICTGKGDYREPEASKVSRNTVGV